uniref:Pan3 C-terminal knob domain-containing protein n=1 Tax=Biomphalaria glabrata TaxID=6526 RepID=A0A2C9KP60_BIOGL
MKECIHGDVFYNGIDDEVVCLRLPFSLLQQQEDMTALVKIILALACNNLMCVQRDNIQTAIEGVQRNYSPDLKNLICYLLQNTNRVRSVNDVMPMIGARFFTQLDTVTLGSDVLEYELAKEIENGRLF